MATINLKIEKKKVSGGKNSDPGRPSGFTTFGEQVVAHEDTIRAEAAELAAMTNRVKKYLTAGDTDFMAKTIIVGHMNAYCPERIQNPEYLLPAEFAFYPFTMNEGLKWEGGLQGLIDPEIIPKGLRLEAQENAKELSLPMIGKGDIVRKKFPNCLVWKPATAYSLIKKWLAKYRIDGEDWIFLQREHIPMMNRCLKYMKYQESNGNSEDHGIILAPISLLVLIIRQLDEDIRIPIIPNEGAAEKIVAHAVYAYLPQLGCLWHQLYQNSDTVEKCSSNIVRRMIYNILAYFRNYKGYANHSPFFKPAEIPKDPLINY